MSTSNENGTEKGVPATRTRKKAASPLGDRAEASADNVKGGLIKAPKHEIMELADHTRVMESDSLPNGRPITLSNMDVVSSLTSAGQRPIMSDSFEVSTTDTLPGHRPIAVSTLVISDLDTLPGHRPIASNDIDEDSPTLMGYLD
jgi:hypothetical protein